MTATLACCRAFTPWRLEAARSAAAWLDAVGAGPVDAVRADLDSTVPRDYPRPAVDGRLRHTVSSAAPPPRTWSDICAYAESSVRATRTWTTAGIRWEAGYSGTCGLVDHLVMALLRGNGTVPAWTAHLIDLPTHRPDGKRLDAPVAVDALLRTCARLVNRWEVPEPDSDQAADWVLALIAGGADRIVVGSEELADALASTAGWVDAKGARSRVEVWARPAVREWAMPPAPAGALGTGAVKDAGSAGVDPGMSAEGSDGLGRVAITAAVDAPRLDMVTPVLQALTLLDPVERGRIRLTLVTADPMPVATALRRLGLEEDVAVVAPDRRHSLAGQARGGHVASEYALVVDNPIPDGLTWSPAPLPDLADAEAGGRQIILLAPQDSPLTRRPVAQHLPAEHVSAARALLSRLAAGTSP